MTAAPELGQTVGCDRLFENLYRRYEGDVYRLALQLVGQREDAEDVTQVAFLDAYRALARGNPPRTPRPWLFAIARNVCARRFRAQQRRPREVQLDPEIFEARADGNGAIVEELRSALQRLSFEQRSALVLREFQGLCYADIATRLELSVPAVETLLFRARRALRDELEKADVTPSVPARRAERKRKVLAGLLSWPVGMEKLLSWLGTLGRGGFGSLGRGGLGLKAAGITAASVIGTVAVGTGVVPLVPSPAGELPPAGAHSTPAAPTARLASAPGSAGRPSPAAELEAPSRPAPSLPPPVLEAPSKPTPPVPEPSQPEPSLLKSSMLQPPSVPAPSLLEPPALEPPSVPAPSLPEPPALEPPSLPAPPLPEPPELAPPLLPEPPSLPPSLPPLPPPPLP